MTVKTIYPHFLFFLSFRITQKRKTINGIANIIRKKRLGVSIFFRTCDDKSRYKSRLKKLINCPSGYRRYILRCKITLQKLIIPGYAYHCGIVRAVFKLWYKS